MKFLDKLTLAETTQRLSDFLENETIIDFKILPIGTESEIY